MMPEIEPEFIIEDPRGRLIQVTSKSIWKQLNVIIRKKGTLGGGHYHKKTSEFFYVFSGKLILKIYSLSDCKTSSSVVKQGSCFEVIPMQQHYMKFQEDTALIVLYSEAFDQQKPDTFIAKSLPKLEDVFDGNE